MGIISLDKYALSMRTKWHDYHGMDIALGVNKMMSVDKRKMREPVVQNDMNKMLKCTKTRERDI